MPGPSPGFALFLAILLLGVCSQIVQPLLIRESLVVFYGNEVSLGGPFSVLPGDAYLVTHLRG